MIFDTAISKWRDRQLVQIEVRNGPGYALHYIHIPRPTEKALLAYGFEPAWTTWRHQLVAYIERRGQ